VSIDTNKIVLLPNSVNVYKQNSFLQNTVNVYKHSLPFYHMRQGRYRVPIRGNKTSKIALSRSNVKPRH